MRLGIFAKTFSGQDPLTVMQRAHDTGYSCVQYNMACSGLPSVPDALTDDVCRAVTSASKASNVAVSAVSGTYNMAHPDPKLRNAGAARLEVMIRRASALGTGLVTLCTGSRDATDQWRHHPDNTTPGAWRDMLDQIERACIVAEACNIRLGIEPELGNVICDATAARRLIDTLKSPAIGIVLDPANLFETTTPEKQRAVISGAIDLLGDHIVMAHAKDRDALGGFVAAGQGVVDFKHLLSCLSGTGFEGDLVTHGLDADQATDVNRFLANALDAL